MARKTPLSPQPTLSDAIPTEPQPVDNIRLESLIEALMVRVSNLETASSQVEADAVQAQTAMAERLLGSESLVAALIAKIELLERQIKALESPQAQSIGATGDHTADGIGAIEHKLTLLNNSVGAY